MLLVVLFPSLKGFNRGPGVEFGTCDGCEGKLFPSLKGFNRGPASTNAAVQRAKFVVSIPQRVQPWPSSRILPEQADLHRMFPSLKGFNRGPV